METKLYSHTATNPHWIYSEMFHLKIYTNQLINYVY